jgi:hypothetical protein
VVVLRVEIVELEPGAAGSRVDIQIVVLDGDRPEEPAVGDAGVEVVQLCGCRIRRILVEEVESGERERAAVDAAVEADVDAGHEAVVDVEEQPPP